MFKNAMSRNTLRGNTRSSQRTGKLLSAALLLAIAVQAHAEGEGAQPGAAQAASATPPLPSVLFRNVRIFDGKSAALSAPSEVLVRGNHIERISSTPIKLEEGATPQVIDGGGRTLMPGLIDAHAHLSFINTPMLLMASADPGYLQIRAAVNARGMLMDGYTAVRDVSGPVFGMKRAIDEGLLPGPRIWPSGTMISQTSGHNDFRTLGDLPSTAGSGVGAPVRHGYSVVADGADAVLTAAREQLMQGASQIKLAGGGGVSSNFDPIDVTEYTKPEFEAAVAAADNWGTYVAVHAYTPKAIRTAVEAGVKSIEHGQLIDEPTMKLLAERGVWLSLQPFLDDEDAIPTAPGSDNEKKYRQVADGTDNAYKLAKKYHVKVAFGTDIQFNPKGLERQNYYLPKLVRWFSPAEALKMATADNAELLSLSGPRNPYPGKLGVVENGALADLLLVDGDPLSDIKLLENPAKNLLVIMKDGTLYKNLLAQ
ncbi:metal-dependent hydrolase family protein [Pseudomonas panipatensis]|uniref:metal-dependent hydrolase family protein n=1 Tax=Pseudomonas panipatensis TaxID=428992 RepID=UPI0035AFEECB